MFRVSICYNRPDDPSAFLDYYSNTHIPLVKKLPGLAEFTAGKCHALDPDQEPPYFFSAQLTFSNLDDFQLATASPEMADAAQDIANFASGGASIFWTEDEFSN